MESSDPSIKTTSESPTPPTQRWAGILGMAIAILTIVIPTLAIVYYSSPNSRDSVLKTIQRTTRRTTRQIIKKATVPIADRPIVRIAD